MSTRSGANELSSLETPDATDGASPRPLRAKGNARRNAIMDSAEILFAERGYFGCSMRDISKASGAALGIISHYFQTKEELFNDLIERKLPVLQGIIREAMSKVVAEKYSDQDVIEAFIRPFLTACVDEDSDVRYYIKCTSHFMIFYSVHEVSRPITRLLSVSDMFYEALRPKMPDRAEPEIQFVMYLIEAALIFMVQDTGFLDRLSKGGRTANELDQLIKPAAAFFAAGARFSRGQSVCSSA